jgi:hypothetical protein
MNYSYATVIVVAGMLAAIAAAAEAQSDATGAHKNVGASAVVDAGGNLRVPNAYRDDYQFLGTWSVAADQARGAKDIHVVYASPGSVAAYRKTGHFPDDSVLVKEVLEAATAQMTTGTVSHAEKLKGWFVMVRDTKGRFIGNKLWGDGWGWSWFDAGNPAKTTTINYKTDCQSCHVPARASDWIYVKGYPPLK